MAITHTQYARVPQSEPNASPSRNLFPTEQQPQPQLQQQHLYYYIVPPGITFDDKSLNNFANQMLVVFMSILCCSFALVIFCTLFNLIVIAPSSMLFGLSEDTTTGVTELSDGVFIKSHNVSIACPEVPELCLGEINWSLLPLDKLSEEVAKNDQVDALRSGLFYKEGDVVLSCRVVPELCIDELGFE